MKVSEDELSDDIDAHFAPGGADYAVKLFLSCVSVGQFDAAHGFIAPEVPGPDEVVEMDLPDINSHSWAPTTKLHIVGEGAEAIRYVYYEGADRPILLDPAYLHHFDFYVRHTPRGWQIVHIAEEIPPDCQQGPTRTGRGRPPA